MTDQNEALDDIKRLHQQFSVANFFNSLFFGNFLHGGVKMSMPCRIFVTVLDSFLLEGSMMAQNVAPDLPW